MILSKRLVHPASLNMSHGPSALYPGSGEPDVCTLAMISGDPGGNVPRKCPTDDFGIHVISSQSAIRFKSCVMLFQNVKHMKRASKFKLYP